MYRLQIKGNNKLILKASEIGFKETYCKVYENGKRAENKDGYFSNRNLINIDQPKF